MAVNLPPQFFTPESMGTLVGATGVTWVVANTFQAITNKNPKWLAWVIAEVVCFVGPFAAGQKSAIYLLTAFVNGCLVYLTAGGVTTLTNVLRAGRLSENGRARGDRRASQVPQPLVLTD